MRMLILTLLVSSLAVGTFGKPVELRKPAQNDVVPLLTDAQLSYIRMPFAERRVKFADKRFRNSMGMPSEIINCHPRKPYWPRTVEFSWLGDPELTYTVRVQVKGADTPFYQGEVKGCSLRLDNLEIAREYEWQVKQGEDTSIGRFKTEDRAPRLLRFPGVPNVRDFGGRIGRNGCRVKQGRIFRSAGLNDNAKTVYYTKDECRALFKSDGLDPETEKAKARLEQLKAWRKNVTFMDRKDAEYVDWCGRHPKEPVSVFLKSRIKRAQEAVEKGMNRKIVKERQPGAVRFSPEERDQVIKDFGIKTDLDLRSDAECYGMTGSPFGASVTWQHISSSAYGGMQSDSGRASFKKVFKIFLDEKNYPIDLHCIAGQDRTGSVAFILSALLGVEENELYLDWEVTGFWNHDPSFNHGARFDSLVRGFSEKHPAATLQESVELYVLSLGYTAQDIDTFRELMLEKK